MNCGGKRAAVPCARLCGNPQGRFFLHHDGYTFSAAALFKQLHKNRRRNIIRKVRADDKRRIAEIFPRCFEYINFQYVGIKHIHVVKLRQSFFKHRQKRFVNFNGKHAFCAFCKLFCKNAYAGAYFKRAYFFVYTAFNGNARADVGIYDEILPKAF